MKKVDITVCRAQDGTYSAYCNEHPALFGMGSTAAKAKEELEETLRLTKEEGREKAFLYPDWMDEDYEFVTHWEVRTLLEYYSGIITPTALGHLAEIEEALHRLGKELMNTAF